MRGLGLLYVQRGNTVDGELMSWLEAGFSVWQLRMLLQSRERDL